MLSLYLISYKFVSYKEVICEYWSFLWYHAA